MKAGQSGFGKCTSWLRQPPSRAAPQAASRASRRARALWLRVGSSGVVSGATMRNVSERVLLGLFVFPASLCRAAPPFTSSASGSCRSGNSLVTLSPTEQGVHPSHLVAQCRTAVYATLGEVSFGFNSRFVPGPGSMGSSARLHRRDCRDAALLDELKKGLEHLQAQGICWHLVSHRQPHLNIVSI